MGCQNSSTAGNVKEVNVPKQGPLQHEGPRRVRRPRRLPEPLYVTVLRQAHQNRIRGSEIAESEVNKSKAFKGKCAEVQISPAKSKESPAESQLHLDSKSKEIKVEPKPRRPSWFKRLRRFFSRTSKKTDQQEASQKNQVIEELSSNENQDKVTKILYDELNSKYQDSLQLKQNQKREFKEQIASYLEELKNKQRMMENVLAENSRLQRELGELRRDGDLPNVSSEQELREQQSRSKEILRYKKITLILKAENKILQDKFDLLQRTSKATESNLWEYQRIVKDLGDELKSQLDSGFYEKIQIAASH